MKAFLRDAWPFFALLVTATACLAAIVWTTMDGDRRWETKMVQQCQTINGTLQQYGDTWICTSEDGKRTIITVRGR